MSTNDTAPSRSCPPPEWSKQHTFRVRCHCGLLVGCFLYPPSSSASNNQETETIENSTTATPPYTMIAWDCDCSDCAMRRNVHIIVPGERFLEIPTNTQNSILYQWGTRTAERRFCRTCGILPWYKPRSNPNAYAITIHCIDWDEYDRRNPELQGRRPTIQVELFDGVHWEDTIKAMREGKSKVDITQQSNT